MSKIRISKEKKDKILEGIQNCYFVNMQGPKGWPQNFVTDVFVSHLYPKDDTAVDEPSAEFLETFPQLQGVEIVSDDSQLTAFEFSNANAYLTFIFNRVLEHAVDAREFVFLNTNDSEKFILRSWPRIISRFEEYMVHPLKRTTSSQDALLYPERQPTYDPLTNLYDTNKTKALRDTKAKLTNEFETLQISCISSLVEFDAQLLGFYEESRHTLYIFPFAHILDRRNSAITQRTKSVISATLAHTFLHELAHIIEPSEPNRQFHLVSKLISEKVNKYDYMGQDRRIKSILDDPEFKVMQNYLIHGERFRLVLLYLSHKIGFVRDGVFEQIKAAIQAKPFYTVTESKPVLTKTGRQKMSYGRPVTTGNVVKFDTPKREDAEDLARYEARITYDWELELEQSFIDYLQSEGCPIIMPKTIVERVADLNAKLIELDPRLVRLGATKPPRPNDAQGSYLKLDVKTLLVHPQGFTNLYLVESEKDPFELFTECVIGNDSIPYRIQDIPTKVPFIGVVSENDSVYPIYSDGVSDKIYPITLEEFWWILSL